MLIIHATIGSRAWDVEYESISSWLLPFPSHLRRLFLNETSKQTSVFQYYDTLYACYTPSESRQSKIFCLCSVYIISNIQ